GDRILALPEYIEWMIEVELTLRGVVRINQDRLSSGVHGEGFLRGLMYARQDSIEREHHYRIDPATLPVQYMANHVVRKHYGDVTGNGAAEEENRVRARGRDANTPHQWILQLPNNRLSQFRAKSLLKLRFNQAAKHLTRGTLCTAGKHHFL